MKDFRNYDLLSHNTFGMSCRARRFVEYDSEDELCRFLSCEVVPGTRLLHIGSGSNLLLTGDFDGTVLHSGIKTIERMREDDERVWLRIGSGMVWDELVSYTVESELYGAENLSLIPGEVGASAVQNIGAYGVEAKDIIETVEAIDLTSGKRRSFSNADCRYAYRSSIFKHELKGQYAVTYVTFRLSKVRRLHLDYGNISSLVSNPSLREVRETIIRVRREKLPDPNVMGNAGSFFMNPVITAEEFNALQAFYPSMPHYETPEGGIKIPAAWLIEQCGWKGRSLGRAGVYEKQPLVLVNLGGATAEEVMTLANTVSDDVKDKFGIRISPEVNIV